MPTNTDRTWSRADIIAALRAATKHKGRPPGKRDWHRRRVPGEPRRPATPTVLRRFGSWNAALQAAGLRPTLRKAWSQAQIVDAIRAWTERTGAPPVRAEWSTRPAPQEADRPTDATVIAHFGAWDVALRAAGIEPPRNSWSASEVVAAIKAFAAREGRPPTARDWMSPPLPDRPRPTRSAVEECFGSWNRALEAAGFAPHRRNWDRDEILAALREFARRKGRVPRQGDWTRTSKPGEPPHPSRQTVVNQFGSWSAALTAAGLNSPAGD